MKKKYSTLLNFALATCVATTLVACSDGDSTGPKIGKGSNPKVSIGGVVQDTNGRPLSNVWVTCQNSRVKTNEGGVYYHNNMQIINVAGTREGTTNSYDEFDQPVLCVVEAPTGYLGAQVWVYPEAQVVNTLYDNTSEELTNTNQPILWFDGMYAQAATAWLPKLDSEVCGVLRHCDTGEPIVDTQLRLDMWAVDNNDVDEQAQAHGYTNEVTYSTGMYQTTTDTFLGQEGTFCIDNVPDDSILRLYAPQYKDLYVDGNGYADVSSSCSGTKPCNNEGAYITTTNEGTVNLGNVCVSEIPSSDSIQPCVADIEGWVYPLGALEGWDRIETPWSDDYIEFALLNDDITGQVNHEVKIMFNESLRPGAIDENSVVIWDHDAEDYITDFTVNFVGNTLTITTADAIPADDHIFVYLLRDDFRDLAGNFLHAYDISYNRPASCEDVFFVEEFYSNNNTPYVVVAFKIHSPDETDVDSATGLVQECLNYSKTVSNQTDLQDEYPKTFRSEMDTDGDTFWNLNKDSSYEDRLEALADVLECPNDVTYNANVENGYASISFVAPTMGAWEISGDGFCDDNCDGSGDGAAETSVIGGVSVGDDVCVDSYDDFDNLGAQVCITVGDCVAPTTVLNFAYNTCGHLGYNPGYTTTVGGHIDGTGTDSNGGYDTYYAAHLCVDFEAATLFEYGDGGENTGEGTPGVCGIPTLNITCRLLKDPADAAQGAVTNPITFFGLYDGTDTPAPSSGYGPYTGFALYDATEFEAWVPFADTIGVAFSEDIAMTTGGTIGGSTTWTPGVVTSWTVGNNITTSDDGNSPDGGEGTSADLVQITVADVLSLANDYHQEIMDFSLAVEDTSGNPADNAQVVINDLMPPFVEYAYWDGGLTIKFNESIAPCIDGDSALETTIPGFDCGVGSSTIVLWDVFGNHDPVSLDGATLSDVDGGTDNLLEIPAVNLSSITGDENFPSTTDNTYALVYDEDIYDDLGFTGPYQHGAMNWGAIPDARGNMWADYDSAAHGSVLYRDVDGEELCNMPSFAVADVLGPFTVTGIGVTNFTNGAPASCTGGAGNTGTMPAPVNHVMSYSFSHPLNLEAQYWEDQDVSGSIDCTSASGTQLCTLAEVNAGMTSGAWVDQNVRVCTDYDCTTTSFVGDVSYLAGVRAVLAADRMSMTITVENQANPCYGWQTNDYMLPVWNVWSAFNVGTFKQLNLQGVP